MDKSQSEQPEKTEQVEKNESKSPHESPKEKKSVLASVLASGATVAVSKNDPLAVTVYVPSSSSRSNSPKPPLSPKCVPAFSSKEDEDPVPICPTPEEIVQSKGSRKRVRINVGGEVHEILWDNLGKLPDTRLGQLKNARNHKEVLSLCDDYCLESNEYFFDRLPKSFSIILNLYRTSKLHLCEEICVMEFLEELEYWGVDESHMDGCCQLKLQQRRDQLSDDMKKDTEYLYLSDEEEFGDSNLDKLKKNIWDLFEKSVTLPQRVTGFLSLFFILLSVLTLSLSTMPDLQELHCKSLNTSACLQAEAYRYENNLSMDEAEDKFPDILEVREHFILDDLEIVCIIWFTLEYLLRLFAAPNKWKFFCGWLNAIDLIAILPFYVSLFLVFFDTAGRVLQVLRVIRILRIFKLARHSTGLQSLGFTLRHSYQNLGVLLLFITVGVVIFAALAFFAEKDNNRGNFESIPHSFYWSLITMTTVGYGDIVPTTLIGKIISMIAGVCGLVVIALPVGIISNNFQLFYEEQKKKEKAMKRRKHIDQLKDNRQGKSYLQVSLGDNVTTSCQKDVSQAR